MLLTMLRGPAVLTCLIIVLMCVIGFGFNSYRSIASRLRRSDEYSDKLRSQYDAMIAQIRVLQEHKTRLDARLQSDAQHHKEELEEILNDRKKMGELLAIEKNDLKNRIDSLTENGKRLENELLKVTDGLASAHAAEQVCIEGYEQMNVSATANLRHLKQVCSNEAALYMGKVANLERHILQLQSSCAISSERTRNTQISHHANKDIPDSQEHHDTNFQIPVPDERAKDSFDSSRISDHPSNIHESAFLENVIEAQENKDRQVSKLYSQIHSNLSVAESLSKGHNVKEEEIEQNPIDQREAESHIHLQRLHEQNSQQLEKVLQVAHLPDQKGRHDVLVQKERQSNTAVEEEEGEEQYQEEHN